MDLIILIALIFLVAKTFTIFVELLLYRKEVVALFLLNKNISNFFYKKESPYSHHLIYKDYNIHALVNMYHKHNKNKIKTDEIRKNMFFKKNGNHISFNCLTRVFILGFFFKRKISNMENAFAEHFVSYMEDTQHSQDIIDINQEV